MRNQLIKYSVSNLGSFIELDDKDLNELCSLELNLLHISAVMYLKQVYQYKGKEMLLSHKELIAILKSTAETLII